jgi:pimeloyl-ACP methyl ester carboxylesterase
MGVFGFTGYRKAARASITACWLFAAISACLMPPLLADVQVNAVSPSATDAELSDATAPHRIYVDTAGPLRNQLLVFLPGTGGTNAGPPRPFSLVAAQLGYHVVELAYPNSVSATVCWREIDPSCFEEFRREIIEGVPTSSLISVNHGGSIENRLEKLLRMLDGREPVRHWGQFLDRAGHVKWEKVVLAGQSQGGGHAALMARDHKVARLLLFGAPKDYDMRRHKPAAWYTPQGQTPADRIFALVHIRDEQGCSFSQQIENFRAMGMTDQPVDIDASRSPYENGHILVTAYPGRPISSKAAHVAGISNPIFKPVWVYMLSAGSDRQK